MFTPLSMGTNRMLGVDNSVPLTTNNFEIRIYNMDGSSPAEFSNALTLSTDTIGSITEEQDVLVVHYGNGLIKFPGKVNYGEVEWTLNCFCEPNVADALREWRELVFDPKTERRGLPSEYMKQVFFVRYDGQGNERDIIRCPGTWVGALNNGEYAQEGGAVVKLSVPLHISKAIYLKRGRDF